MGKTLISLIFFKINYVYFNSVPESLRQCSLEFYAANEEIKNGERIWYLNHKKGFVLPDNLHVDLQLENPLRIDLNHNQLTADGHFR